VGVSGVRRNAAVAACVGGTMIACCEQERLTRVRGVKLQPGTVPSEALDAVLKLAGRLASDIAKYAVAESDASLPDEFTTIQVDHHEAHAASAFYTSSFDQAAVIVCDHHSSPPLSVWMAGANGFTRHPWESGAGLASLYSACAAVFGFADGREHHLEALARLDRGDDADRAASIWGYADGVVWAKDGWPLVVADWLGERPGLRHRARVAAACQRALGRLLLAVARDVRAALPASQLCLGGGLFYNTYFTTLLRRESIFDDVFVAPNPGNAGLAAGAALAVSKRHEAGARQSVSPFLGPRFDLEEIKAILDNCKLSYDYCSEQEASAVAVDALRRGHLVGWFQGRMEWGHRALGNRSILASPLSPYALDNLNVFLKQRERHRAYGVSVPEEAAAQFFSGPSSSEFMEFEYDVRDPELFRHIMLDGTSAIRVQTIPRHAEARRFHDLHEAFGAVTGVPVLVNTSFNSVSEPIVCTPRDAIRVFFSTGLDLLVLDRFVVRK